MPHSHGEAGHSHAIGAEAQPRWLWVAFLINLVFMVAEVVVGLIANSVALISDAAHMLTDAGAIALALGAITLARRPPSGRYTFGLRRTEILSAQINGAALLLLAAVIGTESVGRLLDPADVDGSFVIVIGLVGAGANGVAAWALARANRSSLNVEGAYLHNLYDLLSSLAAAGAGLAIVLTGFDRADPLAALLVCVLMLRAGWSLLRDSGRILLEGTPKGMDAREIGEAIAAAPGIVEVHDLHVWEVTSGFPALAAHVLVPPGDDCHARRRELQRMLHERFGIDHTTLQVDHLAERRPLAIETAPRR